MNQSNTTSFSSAKKAAEFIAELVRQGIVYEAVETQDGDIDVKTTGGH